MEFVRIGDAKKPAAVLLHGGGLSTWSLEAAAGLLAEDYCCILPVLDGHAGSDRAYKSIEENARGILELADSETGGRAALLAGVSLGAQTALEMLAQRPDFCRAAVIESALCVPSRLTAALAGPGVRMSAPLVKKRWFAKMQADYLGIPQALFEAYYRDTCAISAEDMASFLRANALYAPKPELRKTKARVLALCGGREHGVMKRSARLAAEAVPRGETMILPGLRHGELSMARPEEYARLVRGFASIEA